LTFSAYGLKNALSGSETTQQSDADPSARASHADPLRGTPTMSSLETMVRPPVPTIVVAPVGGRVTV
jgi:hypothetical protein